MYCLAVVLLVAAFSVQDSSSAETDVSDINDPVLRALAQSVANLLDGNYEWWKALNGQAVQNTEVAKSLATLARQLLLHGWWFGNSCVGKIRNEFNDLRNKTIKVYQDCGKSLALTADAAQRLQTDVKTAIDGLKKYDAQIQELEKHCSNLEIWRYFACQGRLQIQAASLRREARTDYIDPIYQEVQQDIQQSGDKLASCVSDNSASLVQETNKTIQELDAC